MSQNQNNELYGSKLLPFHTLPMVDILNKVRTALVEPKVFGVMIRSGNHVNIYVGVHYSLEEAFGEAKKRFIPELPSNKAAQAIDLELFVGIPASEIIKQMCDMTEGHKLETHTPAAVELSSQIDAIKESKNQLMRSIIATGDQTALSGTRGILNTRDIKFVEAKIMAKNKNTKN